MASNFVFLWVSVCVCVSCAFLFFFLPVCFLEKEEGYVVGWVGRGARKRWGEEIIVRVCYMEKLFSEKKKENEWEVFSIHMYDRGLVSKMGKGIKTLNN